MLCPRCGTSVGDAIALCASCSAAQPQAAEEKPAPLPDPGAEYQYQEDGLVMLFNIISSPMGKVLSALIGFMVLLLGMLVVVPQHGLIGCSFIALAVFGFVFIWAAPMVYTKDMFKKRLGMRVAGAALFGLGVLCFSVYTGKSVREASDVVDQLLNAERPEPEAQGEYYESDYSQSQDSEEPEDY